MSERADHILELIDGGLQSSLEHGYGTDRNPTACARCQLRPLGDGDLCNHCRAFLLGDSDWDPKDLSPEEIELLRLVGSEQFREAVTRLADAFAMAFSAAAEQITAVLKAYEPVMAELEALDDEPAHRRRERELLAERRRSHRRTNRWPVLKGVTK